MNDLSKLKLYEFHKAPNPRRVRIFMAEKGIQIPIVQVNLREGEHLQEEFKSKNPRCEVPALELEDGTIIAESVAICRYLEAICPTPPLFGETPVEKAKICMWDRHADFGSLHAISEALRNSNPFFKKRALTGPRNYKQIPELVERGMTRISQFFVFLDEQLSKNDYVAGDKYSIADITALVSVDFAQRVKVSPGEDLVHLRRWYDLVCSRPSYKA